MKEQEPLERIALALDALVALKLFGIRDHPPSGVELNMAPVLRWAKRASRNED